MGAADLLPARRLNNLVTLSRCHQPLLFSPQNWKTLNLQLKLCHQPLLF